MTLSSWIHSFFASKLLVNVDDERPVLVLSVPSLGGEVGVTAFHPQFWLQLSTIVLMESLVNVLVATVIYYCMIDKKRIADRSWTPSPYLVGYGIILPMLLYLPFHVIHWLDLRNLALKVGAASAPTVLFFRTLEAMYGMAPSYATKSLKQYQTYFIATVQFDFDDKTQQVKPCTIRYLVAKTIQFLYMFLKTSALFSILIPHHYQVFPRRELQRPVDLLYWGNILNNYLMALFSASCLEVGSVGIGLATSLLSGLQTMDLNDLPLTHSSSPSDFWANRWNRLVSHGLKRGVFRPVRAAGWSRSVAALCTFVASGLLHEYILLVHSASKDQSYAHYESSGSHMVFFVWCGIVLVLEHFFKDLFVIKWMRQNLPAPVRTSLVLLTVLPVASLFTDEYVSNHYYSDFGYGFPRLVWMRTAPQS